MQIAGAGQRGAEPNTPPGELPTVFGRYLLLKRLSRGGMGEIFLAKLGEIEGFEKLVIIKKILPNLVENQDFIARFIDEAQVAIKLNHANIAPVYEVGRVEGEYFLAIEYVEGRDLRRLVQRCRELGRRVPTDLCLFIARELVSGLAYAHRRTDTRGSPLSVVHCDISPPNVMLSFEGEVKIIDFGIARSTLRTAGSNPNMGFGKFGYMAPEQILRGGVIDRRTDLYAVGVMLYELLVGERLYQFPEGADYRQIARTVCQGRFLSPSQRDPKLDPKLDPLVCKALATQKEDRYQSAEEFRDALQQKLYQMNPTISADSLGRFMEELFGLERERERQELAEMRAVDVGAFQQELQGSATHTVTFARASMEQRLPGLLHVAGSKGELREPPAAVQPALSRGQGDTEPRSILEPRQKLPRRRVAAGGVIALLFGGAAVATALRQREPQVQPMTVSTAPAPALRVPAPVVVPLQPQAVPPRPGTPGLPTASTPRPPQPTRRPAPVRPTAKARPVGGEALPVPSPQTVESKFKQVGFEYSEFKRQFGARLEERWQQILQEAALGKRDQQLDDLLNQLRREMQRVRAGE